MEINRYHIKSPTEVITTTLGISKDYREKCIKKAYNIGDKQNNQTNVKAIMSSYGIWTESDLYNPILDKIISIVQNKTYPQINKDLTYFLENAWTAIYKEGHYTIKHNHIPSQISFVYYLKSNEISSPLVFDSCDFEIKPYDDLLVLFPSYLYHSVPTHKGEDRICLAGNLSYISIDEHNQ